MKFYPREKGGGVEKVLAMLKGGGHKRFRGSFDTLVLAILKRGCKMFPRIKSGGGQEKF